MGQTWGKHGANLVILCQLGKEDTHVVVRDGKLVVLAHSSLISLKGFVKVAAFRKGQAALVLCGC